jgi:hypothetical protein
MKMHSTVLSHRRSFYGMTALSLALPMLLVALLAPGLGQSTVQFCANDLVGDDLSLMDRESSDD